MVQIGLLYNDYVVLNAQVLNLTQYYYLVTFIY